MQEGTALSCFAALSMTRAGLGSQVENYDNSSDL
jgi:hypothetical protein